MKSASSKTLRKKINNLIKARDAIVAENVSEQIIESINLAISELEDAYIAEVNFENENS